MSASPPPGADGAPRPADAADLPGIFALLEAAGLPLAGLEQTLLWVVEGEDGRILACAGLEVHGDAGLLRSMVVAPEVRGGGLGGKLVRQIIVAAADRSLTNLSLLTTTATPYFPRFGFESVPRSTLPISLTASAELRGACPESAVAFLLPLPSAPIV